MGLVRSALRFLAREHRRKPFGPRVLTLGRQFIFASPEEAIGFLKAEGVTPDNVPNDLQELRSNMPQWKGTPDETNISDIGFFKLLGAQSVQALDYSAFEGADYVHDLNTPVPAHLHEQFDLIIDAGTIEHVFNVPQALANCSMMLKQGGRIYHSSPSNNAVNHGFYQFSPTLYLDYYTTNAFADLRLFVVDHDAFACRTTTAQFYEFDGHSRAGMMTSEKQLSVIFVGEKTAQSTIGKTPLQGYYKAQFHPETNGKIADAPPQMSITDRRSLIGILNRVTPRPIKRLRLQFLQLLWPATYKSVDTTKKPWGLKLWDEL